ncbi:MAG: hypothetical protein IT310_02030 [Anaerolineales bacterium]|nr:hypothetical protein [Anaerolineales bacterium]
MKKLLILLCAPILILACAFNPEQYLYDPTLTPQPTLTLTPTATITATFTPVTPSATYSLTPTLIGFKTDTPTPAESSTPTAFTPFNKITPATSTPTISMQGFVNIFLSSSEFYKKGCEPGTLKFTAQVADALNVNFVVLFVRFRSKQSGNASEWTSIGMQGLGGGTFVHELTPDEMKAVNSFKNAWVEYQLVATNLDAKELGHTATFSEKITLLDCVPTPTATP